MASLRELRDRIRSVNSTKKITKAQELIATSRITKAQARVEASQPYAHEMGKVMERLANTSSLDHPMLKPRENARTAAIVIVSSDRGMCGGYNNNVFKKAAQLEALLEKRGLEVVRLVTGAKGVGFYQFRDEEIDGQWTGFSQDPTWEATHDVRHHVVEGFLAGSDSETEKREGVNNPRGFDEVHVVYTEFESMLTQTARVQQLLPVKANTADDSDDGSGESAETETNQSDSDFEFEPDADTLMDALLPKYVSRVLYAIFLEASASESASRRTAMKSATDNATELVTDLSRVANQARQAQITQEISEIVGGAGALAESGERD